MGGGDVNTDQCVLETMVDADNKGWNCVAVGDCYATTTVWGREAGFGNVAVSFSPPVLLWMTLGAVPGPWWRRILRVLHSSPSSRQSSRCNCGVPIRMQTKIEYAY